MVRKSCIMLLESKSRWNLLVDENSRAKTENEYDRAQKDNKETAEPGEQGFPDHGGSRLTVERSNEASKQGESLLEAWQGKTRQGIIVNVNLAGGPVGNYPAGGWEGAMLPVRIEAAAKHSLKGVQAGEPW